MFSKIGLKKKTFRVLYCFALTEVTTFTMRKYKDIQMSMYLPTVKRMAKMHHWSIPYPPSPKGDVFH